MKINERPFNPGELRTPVTLKQRTVSTETGGFQVPVWTTIASVLAKWVNAHGSESWTADSIGAEAAATVTIRYRTGIDATCAVEKDGLLWEIVSIDDIRERHELLELKVRRMRAG